ncbi:restriction endonuclease [Psychrobacter urativorans]|uniref:nSTAND3 domain-containing NTPase n=1 Tax=Psychrobacter urativorans TaxID=45610 RepID=UPI0019186FC3|nr:restriction endonuclease [Psychrobacter urativorans]
MSDYTFETLNDKEFEILTVDLLAKELGVKIERFKAGKDGGIDGRFFEGNIANDVVIIQCKHWLKSGIAKLIAECKKTEAAKVKILKPSRYIFATSLELSAQNKKDIFNVFNPYIKCESDIIGKEDINSLLGKYPDVERQHYQLWLASTTVLQSILSNDILGRSGFQLEEIQEFLSKYVRTENHKNAFEKLEELGSIIINGEPGIGKTTLAEQLCFEYAAKGYQLVVVHESITEAEKLYNPELQQIFYFDDFLGSNFLSAIDAKQDSHIVSFMKRVSKGSSKRFILTTRSNILNQGKRLSEKFEQGNLDRNEYEIRIQSLTEFDRAQILYNHIYFGDLSEEFVEQIYIDKRYRSIISHKNFNPRLIEFITDTIKVEKEASPEDYWDYIQKSLDNPKDIWRGMIQTQISDLDRHIVIAIVLNGSPVSEEQIVALLTNLKESGLDITSEYPTVDNIMRGLAGSVLNRNISQDGQVTYSLFNPSIADFVISEYFNRADYVSKLMSCLRTHNALSNLKKLSDNKEINFDFREILKNLLNLELASMLSIEKYTLELVEMSEVDTTEVKAVVERIIRAYPIGLFEKFGMRSLKVFQLAVSHDFLANDDAYLLLVISKSLEDADFDDFKEISKLIELIDSKNNLAYLLKEKVIDFLCEVITDWAIEGYDFENVYYESEIEVQHIYDYIEKLINELDCGLYLDDTEFEKILESLDVDRIINHNIDREADNERGAESYRETRDLNDIFNPVVDPIDDLFSRD